MSIITSEKERIHTQAVGAVMGACCQTFAAIAREMQAECRKHGIDALRVHISSKEDRDADGLVESIKADLADNLPLDPFVAVQSEDDFSVLSDEETEEMADRVRNTVEELLGVFRGK